MHPLSFSPFPRPQVKDQHIDAHVPRHSTSTPLVPPVTDKRVGFSSSSVRGLHVGRIPAITQMSLGSVSYRGVQLKKELDKALIAVVKTTKDASRQAQALVALEPALSKFLQHVFVQKEVHFVFSSEGDTTKLFVNRLLEAKQKATAASALHPEHVRRLEVKCLATVFLTVSQARPSWKAVPDPLQRALLQVPRLQAELAGSTEPWWVQSVRQEQQEWEGKRQLKPLQFVAEVGLFDSISSILQQGSGYRQQLLQQHQSQQRSTRPPPKNRCASHEEHCVLSEHYADYCSTVLHTAF